MSYYSTATARFGSTCVLVLVHTVIQTDGTHTAKKNIPEKLCSMKINWLDNGYEIYSARREQKIPRKLFNMKFNSMSRSDGILNPVRPTMWVAWTFLLLVVFSYGMWNVSWTTAPISHSDFIAFYVVHIELYDCYVCLKYRMRLVGSIDDCAHTVMIVWWKRRKIRHFHSICIAVMV